MRCAIYIYIWLIIRMQLYNYQEKREKKELTSENKFENEDIEL